ncbi:glycosyltransferase, partial [Streptomyces exfoliatus]|uniref:glycosyltransferase n=1 Tax=Streptomyces exfoliatus TaxID=1905 RepID=UPI003C302CD6
MMSSGFSWALVAAVVTVADPSGGTMASVPAVSLIVPTFNEAGNIDELLDGVCAALPEEWDVEVLFVDDSTDDTPEVIEK